MTELRYGYFPWKTAQIILGGDIDGDRSCIHQPNVQWEVAIKRVEEVLTMVENGKQGTVEVFERIVPDAVTREPKTVKLTVNLSTPEIEWFKEWARCLAKIDLKDRTKERIPKLLDMMASAQ